MTKLVFRLKGGSGSGNFGHSGIPGHVGGSASGGGSKGGAVDHDKVVADMKANMPAGFKPDYSSDDAIWAKKGGNMGVITYNRTTSKFDINVGSIKDESVTSVPQHSTDTLDEAVTFTRDKLGIKSTTTKPKIVNHDKVVANMQNNLPEGFEADTMSRDAIFVQRGSMMGDINYNRNTGKFETNVGRIDDESVTTTPQAEFGTLGEAVDWTRKALKITPKTLAADAQKRYDRTMAIKNAASHRQAANALTKVVRGSDMLTISDNGVGTTVRSYNPGDKARIERALQAAGYTSKGKSTYTNGKITAVMSTKKTSYATFTETQFSED